MPLYAEHETIAARIFHSFDQAIRGPGSRDQFPSQSFNCLMMMAVDGHAVRRGEFAQSASIQNVNAMRRPIPRCALLVLDRIGLLTADVLNQSSTTRDIQRLKSKTDCEDRHCSAFSFSKRQQIGFIFFGMNEAEFRMR